MKRQIDNSDLSSSTLDIGQLEMYVAKQFRTN